MLEQAAGYALLAAVSPTALVIAAFYLGSENPRRSLLIFLAGAVLMTAVAAVVLLLVLHAGGLNHPRQRQPRYGLRLGLGVLALGAGLVLARRRPRPSRPDKKESLVTRLMNKPKPVAVFVTGLLVFVPSITFVAAVQAVATAKASAALVVVGLALVVLIDVMWVWLPLMLYLVAPEATTRRLKAVDGWLHTHGRLVLAAALGVCGVALFIDGLVGLV
jgi:Sap, sulfolipid-1-addressing protein